MEKEKLKTIRDERTTTYGPAGHNFRSTGEIIRGILEAHYQIELPGPIPPHVVGLIFVGIKVARASLPFKPNQDNFDDAHNYLDLANELDERMKSQ